MIWLIVIHLTTIYGLKIFNNPVKWFEANKACNKDNLQLPCISSSDTLQTIGRQLLVRNIPSMWIMNHVEIDWTPGEIGCGSKSYSDLLRDSSNSCTAAGCSKCGDCCLKSSYGYFTYNPSDERCLCFEERTQISGFLSCSSYDCQSCNGANITPRYKLDDIEIKKCAFIHIQNDTGIKWLDFLDYIQSSDCDKQVHGYVCKNSSDNLSQLVRLTSVAREKDEVEVERKCEQISQHVNNSSAEQPSKSPAVVFVIPVVLIMLVMVVVVMLIIVMIHRRSKYKKQEPKRFKTNSINTIERTQSERLANPGVSQYAYIDESEVGAISGSADRKNHIGINNYDLATDAQNNYFILEPGSDNKAYVETDESHYVKTVEGEYDRLHGKREEKLQNIQNKNIYAHTVTDKTNNNATYDKAKCRPSEIDKREYDTTESVNKQGNFNLLSLIKKFDSC